MPMKKSIKANGIRSRFKMTPEKEAVIRANPPDLMNRPEFLAWSGLADKTARNYEHRGWIPVIKIGRRRLYRRDSVLSALKKLEQRIID